MLTVLLMVTTAAGADSEVLQLGLTVKAQQTEITSLRNEVAILRRELHEALNQMGGRGSATPTASEALDQMGGGQSIAGRGLSSEEHRRATLRLGGVAVVSHGPADGLHLTADLSINDGRGALGARVTAIEDHLGWQPPPASPPPASPLPPSSPVSGGICSGMMSDGIVSGESMTVYCDVTSPSGPWVLAEVGAASGTNLRTTGSVGSTPTPGGASAKLSHADMMALYTATGNRVGLKWGRSCGYLYGRNLPATCLDVDGCGSSGGSGATVEWGANRISSNLAGPWYAESRFKWPADYLPSACLNSGGDNGECASGCHIGTWSGSQTNSDTSYMSGCGSCGHGAYEVWIWSGAP